MPDTLPHDYWDDTSDEEEDEDEENNEDKEKSGDEKPAAKPSGLPQPPKLPSSPPPASKDDEAASPAPKKPSSTPTPDDAAKKPPSTTTPAPTTTPSNDGGTMTSDRKKPLPFSAAPAKFKSLKKILLNPGETLVFTKLCGIKTAMASNSAKVMVRQGKKYKFVYPTMECDCCFTGQNLLSIPDEPYLKACSTTQMWWHSDFIATFAALSAHQHHKTSEKHSHVKLIHVPYPNGIVEESEKRDLDPEIKVIASVVHDVDHFAVLEVVLGSKVVNVVDGLSVDIRRWIKHVINVFIRCKLLDHVRDEISIKRTQTSQRSNKGDTWELTCGAEIWTVQNAEFMTQRNTWDCGPIACAKILDLYGLWPKDGKVGKLRTFIINAYRQLLEGDTADIYIAVPTIEIDDDDSDGKTTSTPNEGDIGTLMSKTGESNCLVCFDSLRTSDSTVMECCGQSVHAVCIKVAVTCANLPLLPPGGIANHIPRSCNPIWRQH
eukprot:scaffold16047_cov34-Cyclotella_meneghiniana.AAC.1